MLPSVPTFAEEGLPVEVSVWIGISAPHSTPSAIVERLNREFNKALVLPEIRQQLATLGVEPVGGATDAFAQYVKNDVEHWAKIVKAAGIKIE